ncbi:MAG: hypothetical protein M0P27_00530 [Bacteroidales bacterium]|nr:hypothetical protein [Bacteroidales bacterium]
MNTGFDPSGRAFRWQDETNNLNTAYAVLGCPPYVNPDGSKDQDEIMTWSDPKAFRPQVCTKQFQVAVGDHAPPVYTAELTSIEILWSNLVKAKEVWGTASLIANAIKAHYPPHIDQQHLAFAIPNRLNEDAQDALLRELKNNYREVSLLWRPVAIMLDWLVSGDGRCFCNASNDNTAVWVLDLDSAGTEFTRLTWRNHEKDPNWIAPVRACITENRGNPRYTVLNAAWSEIFGEIPERNQLLHCQTASEVQQSLESDLNKFNIWVSTNNRWKRIPVEKHTPLQNTWQNLPQLLRPLRLNTSPQTDDVILVHGWLACYDPQGIKTILSELYPGTEIRLRKINAVAQGSQMFAERRCNNLPTYYDTLAEYKIWTDDNWKQLVSANQEVEPGNPWRLSDDNIRNAFCINRHRDVFSMLIQRLPCDDPEYDFARRLQAGLFTQLSDEIPLRLEATVEAARGNAKFTVLAADNSRPFVSEDKKEIGSVTLTYAFAPDEEKHNKKTATKPEPKHKGYLEAQPVTGRIYDNPENVELLKLLVQYSNGDKSQTSALQNAIKRYRIDSTPATLSKTFPFGALDRWGWKANPHQPTRGLFGTRVLPDRKASELTETIANHLWNNGNIPGQQSARNLWSKLNNYCHEHASQAYKTHIRTLLSRQQPFPSWAEANASGYVLGDQPQDLELLVDYCVKSKFGDTQQAKMFWWSFFRMLCWHTEIVVDPDSVISYLQALIRYLPEADLTDSFNVPRKNALFSILFALHVREKKEYKGFLLTNEDSHLRTQLLTLIEFNGILSNVKFPKTMLANMNQLTGNFSDFVARFIKKEDTVEDRELGSSIGTMQ